MGTNLVAIGGISLLEFVSLIMEFFFFLAFQHSYWMPRVYYLWLLPFLGELALKPLSLVNSVVYGVWLWRKR